MGMEHFYREAVINSSSLRTVREWQSLVYDGRHSFPDLNNGYHTVMIPDFIKLVDTYSSLGTRVRSKEEFGPAMKATIGTHHRPVVIDFIVSKDWTPRSVATQGLGNSQAQNASQHSLAWDEG